MSAIRLARGGKLTRSLRFHRALRRVRPRRYLGARVSSEAGFLRGPFAVETGSLYWTVLASACGLVVGVAVVRYPSLPAELIPAVFMVMCLALLVHLLYYRRPITIRQSLMKWTLGAYFLHLAIGTLIWHSGTLTGYFGGDALTYDAGAKALLQHWSGVGPMPQLPAGKDGFFYMLAGLYYVFGAHGGAGMAVDAAFAAAMIPLLHDATERHFGLSAARFVPPLCLFLPGFLIWSSQLLREAGIYFGAAVAINSMVRVTKRVTFGPLVALVASMVLLFAWRASVGMLSAGGFVVAMLLQRRAKNAFASALTAVAASALVIGVGVGHSGFTFLTHTSLAQINDVRMGSATSAASGFLPSSDISSGQHAIFYLPLGAPLFLFGPLPWEIHLGRQLFAIPDVLIWWALLPSLRRGFKAARQKIGRASILYVAPALANVVGLSLIIANFGTAVRERMQVVVFVVPLIALGLSLRPRRRETIALDPDALAAAFRPSDSA